MPQWHTDCIFEPVRHCPTITTLDPISTVSGELLMMKGRFSLVQKSLIAVVVDSGEFTHVDGASAIISSAHAPTHSHESPGAQKPQCPVMQTPQDSPSCLSFDDIDTAVVVEVESIIADKVVVEFDATETTSDVDEVSDVGEVESVRVGEEIRPWAILLSMSKTNRASHVHVHRASQSASSSRQKKFKLPENKHLSVHASEVTN